MSRGWIALHRTLLENPLARTPLYGHLSGLVRQEYSSETTDGQRRDTYNKENKVNKDNKSIRHAEAWRLTQLLWDLLRQRKPHWWTPDLQRWAVPPGETTAEIVARLEREGEL